MRISDWSSDVCSSDLAHAHAVMLCPHDDRIDKLPAIMDFAARARRHTRAVDAGAAFGQGGDPAVDEIEDSVDGDVDRPRGALEIGRASCREGMCRYV